MIRESQNVSLYIHSLYAAIEDHHHIVKNKHIRFLFFSRYVLLRTYVTMLILIGILLQYFTTSPYATIDLFARLFMHPTLFGEYVENDFHLFSYAIMDVITVFLQRAYYSRGFLESLKHDVLLRDNRYYSKSAL